MKKIFFLLFVALVPFVSFSEEQKLNIIPVEKGDRTEIGVPKISYDPDMQMLSVAFHASGDYMLYIINGSGLKYIVELLNNGMKKLEFDAVKWNFICFVKRDLFILQKF